MSPWIPVVGIAFGAVATILAARLNSRPQDRTVAVAELQAALSEQRIMLDRAEVRADRDAGRIDALEAEVRDCEVGRRADRERFDGELEDLRREMAEMRKP